MENLVERLKEIYGRRKWVLAAQPAVATVGLVKKLTEWEAETLVVASNEGTGELPETEIVYTRSEGDTIVRAIREFFESVESPSEEIQAAVDEFDPDSDARVLAEPFATSGRMLNRKTFGVRRPEWWAWEDKMRVDRLWEDLGIPNAPFRIVDLQDAPAAANELAGDEGTVWVADNTEGWHGGVEMVRWVRTPADISENTTWYEGRAKQVRVMPFLEGLPCSIHGWVTSAGVAVFLPVEINILRYEGAGGFRYAGVSTNWEPPAAVTDEMRGVARLVGESLAGSDGYRGPYGIDGVLTRDGFRPTELNPRMSAGAGVQLGSVDAPLGLLMRAEIEDAIDVDPDWLERTAIEDRKPLIHFGKMIHARVRDKFHVGFDAQGLLIEVESEDGALGEISAGPAAFGSYITASFDIDQVESGKSTAPLVARALNLANEHWDLGLPEMVAAEDVS